MKGASVCVYTILARAALKRNLSLVLHLILLGNNSQSINTTLPITFWQMPQLKDWLLFVKLTGLWKHLPISWSVLIVCSLLQRQPRSRFTALCAHKSATTGPQRAQMLKTSLQIHVRLRNRNMISPDIPLDIHPVYWLFFFLLHQHIWYVLISSSETCYDWVLKKV